jgi:hypothetical protein
MFAQVDLNLVIVQKMSASYTDLSGRAKIGQISSLTKPFGLG